MGALPFVDAAIADNVSGFAWSSNVGWVSANCTDASPACSGTNYGLNVGAGAVTRTLSGYMWSSNIGWVTFNAADMANTEPGCGTLGYPPCNPTATMTVADGKISGWARACTVYASGCGGALKSDTELGGWRGWISLGDSLNYGVLANGTDWTGFAWGGGSGFGTEGSTAVPGWISFRGVTTAATPSVYGVVGTGNAIGPRSISCGVTPGSVAINGSGTWTVSINTTQLPGPHSYTWYGTDYLGGQASGAWTGTTVVTSSFSKTYTTTGIKTGWVVLTAGTPGISYLVNCDGTTVTAGVDTGEPAISVGSFDVAGTAPADPGDGGEVGTAMTLTAPVQNQGDAISGVTFKNRFELDSSIDGLGGDVDFGSPATPIPGSTIATIGSGASTNVTASWTPTAAATYRMRVCADEDAAIGSADNGVISETDETDNCGPWSTAGTEFIVNPGKNLTPDPVTPPTNLEQNESTILQGTFDYSGPAFATSFEYQYEIDYSATGAFDGVADYFSSPATVPSLTQNQLNVNAPSAWTPPLIGTNTYRIRLCVDIGNTISEAGTGESDNCNAAWSAPFSVVAAAPPIDISGASCKPEPRVGLKDKSVVWKVEGVSGGNGTYTYDWEFDWDSDATPEATLTDVATPTTAVQTYTISGTVTAQVTVKSGSETPQVLNCADLRLQVVENT